MFRRLILDHSTALFTIVAFITAATIYLAFTWRALRMKPAQLARFENLPFETETPSCDSPASEPPSAQGRTPASSAS